MMLQSPENAENFRTPDMGSEGAADGANGACAVREFMRHYRGTVPRHLRLILRQQGAEEAATLE